MTVAVSGARRTPVRVAAVQPPSFAGAEEHRNAAQACAFIDEAADAGASYVVFPEGYPGPYSGPMENDAIERVRERARARGVWVSAGRLERGALPDTYHITHVLIDDAGEVRARYRRVQPNHPVFNAYLMGGRHHVLPGDELMTVDAPFGRIGLLICSELFVPELSRILMLRGADLIVAPGGGVHGPTRTRLQETWRAVARARAAENLVYVVVNQNLFGGSRQGRTCIASPESMLAQRRGFRAGLLLPSRAVARPPPRAVRRAGATAGGRLRVPLRAPWARHLARRIREDQGGSEWPLSRRIGSNSPPATGSRASSPTAST
ncbi:MAG: carbon-nitrogen hydrolase family protein [Deltaproteobacteria bacterium]|nr:MAG: carbon-nitrogen hydrolase family protein [Deltaproteobacteria bacterium]